MQVFYHYSHPQTGMAASLVSEETYNIAMKYKDQLDAAVIHDRDFELDYFGFKTLEKSYLLKVDGKIAERPQNMLMRVADGIHGDDITVTISLESSKRTIFYRNDILPTPLLCYSMPERRTPRCPLAFCWPQRTTLLTESTTLSRTAQLFRSTLEGSDCQSTT